MDKGITQSARHLRVDFSNDDACTGGGGLSHAYFHSVGAEAVLIGRRNVDECGIYRQAPGSKQPRNLGEETGREIGAAFADGGAHKWSCSSGAT